MRKKYSIYLCGEQVEQWRPIASSNLEEALERTHWSEGTPA